MQTKRLRLRGALLASLVLGLLALPAGPALADVGVSPTLEVAPATCDLLGATDVLVQVGGLAAGETYMVSVAVASDRTAIDARELSGDKPSVSFVFEDLPNGNSYVVSIANAANTLGASATVALPVCDLPTLPGELPGDAPTVQQQPVADDLAFTGSAPVVPAMGGVLLIQLGIVLIGVAAVIARAKTRDA